MAFSPGGILPLPFQVWLGFPDGILITSYHMGMVRDMLVSSCSPDWGHVERFGTDLDLKLDEVLADRKGNARDGLLKIIYSCLV